jgi:hypothetical protein
MRALRAISSTLEECQGILHLGEDNERGNDDDNDDDDEEHAKQMDRMRILSMIGDVSIYLHDTHQQLKLKQSSKFVNIPMTIWSVLKSQHPYVKSLSEYGGDLVSAPILPKYCSGSDTQYDMTWWLDVGVFSLIAAVCTAGITAKKDIDLLRRLASAKNRQGQLFLEQKNFGDALDVFSASLNLFQSAEDFVNVGWIKMNIITTMRRMAGGTAEEDNDWKEGAGGGDSGGRGGVGGCGGGGGGPIYSEQSSLYARALELVNGILEDPILKQGIKSGLMEYATLSTAATMVLAKLSLNYGTRMRITLAAKKGVCAKGVGRLIQRHLELAMRLGRTGCKEDGENGSMKVILGEGHRQIALFLEEQADRMEESGTGKKAVTLNRELSRRHFSKALECFKVGSNEYKSLAVALKRVTTKKRKKKRR